MNVLENKIKKLETQQLVSVFKGLESNLSLEGDTVNDLVMIELENRMEEAEFCNLLDEVYED